ncbi:MAG TPA: hypothetical protein VGK74_25370 [Symbiobacteriaceae bacterium]|jgi:iron uptake system EfeUOB component EfeO/EfeM
MKLRALVAALYITTALTVAACGGVKPAADPKTPAPAPAATQPAAPAPAPAANNDAAAIKAGVAKMRQQMAPLKEALNAGDAAKAQKYADDTDGAWDTFEDAVKAKDKDLYEKIEDPLHALTAGAKAATLDKKLMLDQVAKLDALLGELTK